MLKKMTSLKCLILTIVLVGIGIILFVNDMERRSIKLSSNNIQIVLSEKEWTKNNIELTIKYNGSLKHIKEYSFDNGKTWSKSNILALGENQKLNIIVKDINDNTYNIDYNVNNIDREGPIILTDNNIQVSKNSKVDLMQYVTVYDEKSGLRDDVVLTPSTLDTSKNGTYTIQISAIDKLANESISKMTVNVVDKAIVVSAKKITLDHKLLNISPGQEELLVATIAPKSTSNKMIKWTSSDSNIASVDAGGKVTAISQGRATITATTSNNIKVTCLVIVK